MDSVRAFGALGEGSSPSGGTKMKIQNPKFKVQNYLVLSILIGVLLLPMVSWAAGLVPCGGQGEPPCQFCHLFVLFKNIVDFLLVPSPLNNNIPLVPLIATVMVVIAGVMFMLAHLEAIGKPDWINQAKSLLWAVFWGLIIIYGAWLIVNLFFQIIGVQTWTGLENWWQIDCPVP